MINNQNRKSSNDDREKNAFINKLLEIVVKKDQNSKKQRSVSKNNK